ncbi:conserved protein of unknown function [Bradyrhizobium sp. ORS 285]|uniref:hypothetical protein n=1 Tax=Bradyrhizobium sp. ORS 285 TaxID=115808 RepID=UPI0002406818|nr:hypothetical protein [Bradyrhizobium sp. ORS 285]CCD88419.1 conserved hypothetical protein [Bradyrhizobium sp. ORS 285]SMX56830.1 conserved protein of unknown function [Bradyrhizobium sp. ORS 285]
MPVVTTTGKTQAELTRLVEDAIRQQPGCETARVPAVHALEVRSGRNWEIPHVILGDSLISDVDRAVMSVQRRLGREFHLTDGDAADAVSNSADAPYPATDQS